MSGENNSQKEQKALFKWISVSFIYFLVYWSDNNNNVKKGFLDGMLALGETNAWTFNSMSLIQKQHHKDFTTSRMIYYSVYHSD